MTPAIANSNVKFVARQLGFDDCRIATATRAPHADDYLEWVDAGHAGASQNPLLCRADFRQIAFDVRLVLDVEQPIIANGGEVLAELALPLLKRGRP